MDSTHGFDLPLTQAELGDTIGLDAVTVNRVLHRLRGGGGLVILRRERLTILDVEALTTTSGFDSGYLHLRAARDGPGA